MTVHACMYPFNRRCTAREATVIVVELNEAIAEEVSRPRVWDSGILSFFASSIDFKGKASPPAKYCGQLHGNRPRSRVYLTPGGRVFLSWYRIESL
ncbi:MAG: hypothetical protein JO166_12190 [Deltaproteobacteria bacterium]|nr:hypothetical protein [Deltaproteobacteria bacterium]